MKFTWKYNLDTEISRLVFTANSIALGFYQKKGFLPFENLPRNLNLPTSIIFPFQEIDPIIWKKLQRVEIDVGQENIDPAILKEFEKKYKNIELINHEELKAFNNSWAKIENRFNEVFTQTFPHIKEKNEIIIMPTQFGTVGSYFDELKGKIFIYIRIDQDPSAIVELLVKSIIREHFYLCSEYSQFLMRKNLWNTYTEIADFILKTTGFADLLSNYESLTRQLENPEIDFKLIQNSNDYFRKLGFPVEKELALDCGKIKLSGKILKNLTITQRKLLEDFLKREGEIISFEQIAQIMWGEEYYDQFSLTAMTKMICQLRQKLKEAGLQKEVIFTKRGQGYVLVQ